MRRHRCFLLKVVLCLIVLSVTYSIVINVMLFPYELLRKFLQLSTKNGSWGDGQEKNNNTDIRLSVFRSGRRTITAVQIQVALVVCRDRTAEAVTMLKSAAALTSNASLVFHVFAERGLQKDLVRQLQTWPKPYSETVEYKVYDITFPKDQNATWWTKLFWQPCANQRLFLPALLTGTDAVIYVDTDTLFLTSLLPIWDTFSRFSSTQLLGMAAEHENKKGERGAGWYNTRSQTPFIFPSGVNSGVILMNLTRLRHSNWSRDIVNYSHVYHSKLKLIDQDLFNIYLHFHPEHLFWLDCSLNYRTDHCMERNVKYSSVCTSAEKQGVQILHGNRRAFHTPGSLRHVYNAFAKYQLGQDLRTHLLYKVRDNLRKTTTPCTAVAHAFVKRLADVVAETKSPDNDSTMAKRQG